MTEKKLSVRLKSASDRHSIQAEELLWTNDKLVRANGEEESEND